MVYDAVYADAARTVPENAVFVFADAVQADAACVVQGAVAVAGYSCKLVLLTPRCSGSQFCRS